MIAAETPSQGAHPVSALSDAQLFDIDGAAVRVASLYAQGPAVLVFVRHFGCLFCKQQVEQLAARREDFTARGVLPIVVGHGPAEQARAFSERYAHGLRVLTDPTREVFRAAGMQRGVATTLTLGVVGRGLRAIAQGHFQTSVLGDPLQQGGVIVLGQDGRELYRFVSKEAGDHPPLDDVLAALPPR